MKIVGIAATSTMDPEKIKRSAEEIKQLAAEHLDENPPTPADIGAATPAQVDSGISKHNASVTAHNDLRLAFKEVLDRVNAFLDSDDTTLDQLSEMITYIKANRSLVESVTTNKVNVADIVDDLVTNVSDKPLSAAQGVVLKELIDALTTTANNAAGSAAAAQTAATEANTKAGNAQTAATEAKDTATAAGNAASTAQTTATEAKTAATAAQTAASEAKSSATAAGNTAAAAQAEAAEAKTAANNAQNNLTAHNTNTEAHADLRTELKALSDRINAVLDSDDTTLDELSEIVAYIKSNKSLIDAIATGKVSVTDIVDNLVTNVANKPLSAAQGVVLKALIDGAKAQVDTNTNNIVGLQKEIEQLTSARAEGDTLEEQLTWLTENGDVTKEYLCADGYYYKAVYKEGGALYTNLLPKATDSGRKNIYGSDYDGDGKNDGYKRGYRLNTAGEEKTASGYSITGYIPCKAGDVIRLKGVTAPTATTYTCNLVFYDSSNTYLKHTDTGPTMYPNAPQKGWYYDGDLLTVKTSELTIISNIANCDSFRFMAGDFPNAIITVNEAIIEGTTSSGYEWQNTGRTTPSSVDYEDRIAKLEEDVEDLKDGLGNTSGGAEFMYINPNIKCINHRGYYTAPENTLSAFRLSKQMGFEYVECDITQSSDGVIVLIHDDTVNRTSNGTGTVTAMTFEALRALDFGSWKGAQYAGEKIPTLDEFLVLCKNLGLHPYIEIKASANFTSAQIANVVAMVKRKGLHGKVTWISTDQTRLGYVKDADPNARLGLIRSSETCISDSTISAAMALRTDTNEVFIDVNYETINEEAIQRAITNNFPVEAWTVLASDIPNVDPYVTGYTTDDARANVVLYEHSK